MATASFDRTFIIETSAERENLLKILATEDKTPHRTENEFVYDEKERARGESLSDRCLSRFNI